MGYTGEDIIETGKFVIAYTICYMSTHLWIYGAWAKVSKFHLFLLALFYILICLNNCYNKQVFTSYGVSPKNIKKDSLWYAFE